MGGTTPQRITHHVPLPFQWTDEQKASLQKDLDLTESSYPGGVLNYIQRARVFLEASAKGENPFEGCQPGSL